MRAINRFDYIILSLCTIISVLIPAKNADALLYNEIWFPTTQIQQLYTHEDLVAQLNASTTMAFYSASSFIDSSRYVNGITEYHVDGDVMTSLLNVFKNSIDQVNSDKGYFLQKLAEMNTISNSVTDYLQYLNSSLGNLAGQSNNDCGKKTADTIGQLIETGAISELESMMSTSNSISLIDVNNILKEKGLSFRLTDDVNQAYSASVPEPASFALLGAGLAGIAFIRRRMRIN